MGTWSASTKAAKNTSSASGAGIYKTVNDDDVEFRFTSAIDSYTAAIPYVDVNFRYNTTSTERMLLRFRLDQAELRYHNGSGWAATHTNTGVDSTAGVKYAVRVEVSGANVKVWRRLASGGAETLIYSRTDAPTYNGDRLRFNAAVDTVISLDDIMILAGDSGLSRTTTMTYRANNEIDTAADYNGTASYTFDAWGRMSTESKNSVTRTYSWTSANLLAGINSSDSAETDVTYAYTGDLKRGWRLENGSLSNYYTWDAGFNVIGEEAVGLPRKTFVPGLAEVVGNDLDTSADYHFLTTDHLGSTRGMWNNSIAQTGSWEFTPYGSPFNFAGPPDVTQLFTGHDLDRATGQYYAPFRYLNSNIGQWGSLDPLGMVDGTNMYGYVQMRPTAYTDPSGLIMMPLLKLLFQGGRQALKACIKGVKKLGTKTDDVVKKADDVVEEAPKKTTSTDPKKARDRWKENLPQKQRDLLEEGFKNPTAGRPDGLSDETLKIYREVADDIMKATATHRNAEKVRRVQQERIKLIDKWLNE